MNSSTDKERTFAPSDFPTALSPEYFAILASCPEQERHGLLLLPDFTAGTDDETVSRTNANANAIHPSLAFQYLSSIPSSSLHDNTDVRIFAQISSAAAILAAHEMYRHQISMSGILSKMAPNPTLKHAQSSSSSISSSSSSSIHHSAVAHVEFLQCCIMASQYRYARRNFISFPISIPIDDDHNHTHRELHSHSHSQSNSQSKSVNDQVYLRYHYLRGIIYYASDDIHLAIQEWIHCIATPANIMSDIILCAWKKSILAKCLLFQLDDEEELVMGAAASKRTGGGVGGAGAIAGQAAISTTFQSPTNNRSRRGVGGKGGKGAGALVDYLCELPHGASHAIHRYFKNETPDMSLYLQVIKKFVKNDLQDVLTLRLENGDSVQQVLQMDGNLGMFKRLIPIARWRKLRVLSKVYDVIPMEKLAKQLGLDQTKCREFLTQAGLKQSASITRVPIEMSIDDEAEVIYFDIDEKEEDLSGKIEQCMALAKRVKDLDIAKATSHKYRSNLAKSALLEKGKEGGSRSVINIS